MKNLFIKLFLLLTVLFLSNGNLFAQANWTKYQGNPVLSGQPGSWYAYLNMSCVLYNADSSRYEMWFTAGAQAEYPYTIGFAWSYDGISWIVYSKSPVLAPTPGQWDGYTVLAPYVLRENGQYKMYYTGITANLLVRIGYATSPDGIEWTKHTSNPILVSGTEPWESGIVAYGCVMPYLNGYRMWYSGGSADFSQSGIGQATSPDGINWQKDTVNNPVLSSGANGQWDRIVFGPRVLYIDNVYYMFYTGEISVYQLDKIGLATSTDGLDWTEDPANPILQPTPGQWDGSRIILGSVLIDADTIKMYYAGTNGLKWDIGLASSLKIVSVEEETIQPTTFSLGQNFPNPFNPSTAIKYSVPQSSQVVVQVFDILGNEIETLVNQEKPVGTYELTWNAANLPSGVYFYQLRAGSFVDTKKMILLK